MILTKIKLLVIYYNINFKNLGSNYGMQPPFKQKNLKTNQITFYIIFGYLVKITNSLMFLKITKLKAL